MTTREERINALLERHRRRLEAAMMAYRGIKPYETPKRTEKRDYRV